MSVFVGGTSLLLLPQVCTSAHIERLTTSCMIHRYDAWRSARDASGAPMQVAGDVCLTAESGLDARLVGGHRTVLRGRRLELPKVDDKNLKTPVRAAS